MSKSKWLIGLVLAAAAALFAPASRAQTNCQNGLKNGNGVAISCNVIAVGSSAVFPSAGIAAISADPITGNPAGCGSNFWTSTAAVGVDPRASLTTPNISKETGNLWVAWDNNTNPTVICAYFSVDSIVGQRLFSAQGSGTSGPQNNGTLVLSTNSCTTAGANKVTFVWDTATSGLPSAVYNALQGTTGSSCPSATSPVNFTVAFTDVSPDDALFVGNQRVLNYDSASSPTYPTDEKISLGYGGYTGTNLTCTKAGTPVYSSYTSVLAQSICYGIFGGDPISGTTIPAITTTPVGALAMLPIVNIQDTSTGGFGNLYSSYSFGNVLSHDVAAGYAPSEYGVAFFTKNLAGLNPSLDSSVPFPNIGIHYLTREPQSGSYTTWEWQVIRQKDGLGGSLSGDTNVNGPSQSGYNSNSGCPFVVNGNDTSLPPATPVCDNPLNWTVNSSFPNLKTRVEGTGEMVKVLENNQDTFGYAFWSLGTFGASAAQNIVYLQLDGVDALYSSWSAHSGKFAPVASGQGSSITVTIPSTGCGGYYNGTANSGTQFACNNWALPTFANILSGSYRAWSINRATYFTSTAGTPTFNPPNIPGFILATQDQTAPIPTAKIPDLLPAAYCANSSCSSYTYPLDAFRAHYAPSAWGLPCGNANNGLPTYASAAAECGGDVAGAIVSTETETQSYNLGGAGGSFLGWVQ
jgi:hypothetical protein